MPYTCLTCARRKIKCDKLSPKCSSCRKGKLECAYQAPQPRRRKRKPSGDLHEKLAEYEQILRSNNLMPSEEEPSRTEQTPRENNSLFWLEHETARLGRLVIDDEGKSRYVDGNFWRSIGDEDIPNLDDEREDDELVLETNGVLSLDPLTAALMGSTLDLLEYHPSYQDAQILWRAHTENVEPICKILHIPSTTKMLQTISAQPALASKTEECLLFAIYHFAVFSMDEEECVRHFGEVRNILLQRYQFAAKQALVNANFLSSTELAVLQAFILFLIPNRFSYDPHVFWVLTGTAVRLAQRIGLHRDGEKLGLPPFEVQIRRRLFFQVAPLDGAASQMSGTGIAMMPHTWDTQRPLNLNDDQIWPGMTEMPAEHNGATDMMFVLARATLGLCFAKTGTMGHGPTAGDSKTYAQIDQLIKDAERDVEENFLRYCDVVDPLHFLTMGLARAGISAMKIRARLPGVKNGTAKRAEKQEILQFALKILDTDAAAYTNGSLKKFRWHARAFFAWGSWDSLIYILTTLRDVNVFSPTEVDAAWQRIEAAYVHHGELLGLKRSLQTVAIARLVVKAWDVNPPSNSIPEPPFITALRSTRKTRREKGVADPNIPSLETGRSETDSSDPSPPGGEKTMFGTMADGTGLDVGQDFDIDSADWVFWDKLIKDFQSQG